MEATRRASIVLPVPGGPIMSTLCAPAAAISRPRLACAWPRTSAKSSPSRSGAAGPPEPPSGRDGGDLALAVEVLDRVVQGGDGDDLDARDHAGLGRVAGRHEQRREALAARVQRDRRARRAPAARCRRATARPSRARDRAGPASRGRWRRGCPPPSAGRRRRPPCGASAGARFTVIRSIGNSRPTLWIAARTRSRLSRTVESGRPTVVNDGKPAVTSTSTKTVAASTPESVAERTRASTGPVWECRCRAVNVPEPIRPSSGLC